MIVAIVIVGRLAAMVLIVATSPLWGWWFLACAVAGRDPWHPTKAERSR